jgi:hypothetical protein
MSKRLIDRVTGAIGKGVIAGLAGTVAMTISSTIEQRIRHRQASSAPAKAAKKVLGIETFDGDAAEARFSNAVHWAYGTGWGVLRGQLRAIGLPRPLATAGHFLAVWGSSLVTLPILDVAPPVTMWPKEEIAIDVWHHLVYAAATGLAYDLLDRRR